MSVRQVRDARDTETKELIYFKGHAQSTYMSDGSNVEDNIQQIKEMYVTDNFLTLKSYLFDLSNGEYTRDDLERLFNVNFPTLVNALKMHKHILIHSNNGTNGSTSYVIESNYSLDINDNITLLTLFWRQDNSWCTLTLEYVSSTNKYNVTLTKL